MEDKNIFHLINLQFILEVHDIGKKVIIEIYNIFLFS